MTHTGKGFIRTGGLESGYAITGYLAVCATVGITATPLMPDYTSRDISEERA